MRKDVLRKLRALPATKEMMEKAKHNTIEKTVTHFKGSYTEIKRIYAAFTRVQQLGAYIKVAVFMPEWMYRGIKTPRYEIFVNPEGMEWITRELDEAGQEVKWSTAMAYNLVGLDWYRVRRESEKSVYCNNDALRTLNTLTVAGKGDYLKKVKGMDHLDRWQECIRASRILAAEKKEQEPWDRDMALMPQTSKAFKEWLQKEAPRENHIFYQYRRGGAKTGYCRHCDCDVSLTKIPHHREEMKCPKCGRSSTLISIGKIRVIRTQNSPAQIIQPITGGYVVRTYEVRYSVATKRYSQPEYFIHETTRTLYRQGRIDIYNYTTYKNKYIRWCHTKEDTGYLNYRITPPLLYKGNMRTVNRLLDSSTALPQLIRAGKRVNIERYLYFERKHPVVEMLAKAGMEDVALAVVRYEIGLSKFDERETELVKILKLDGSRFKRFRQIGAWAETLEWLQHEKQTNTVWPDDAIGYLAKNGIIPDDVAFIADRMSVVKIYHYLARQAERSDEPPDQIITTWRDYLNMAKKAKMMVDQEIIYKPKDLKRAHAEVIEWIEREGIEKIAKGIRRKWPKVDKICQTLKMYEYSDDKYCIVAPAGVNDIVREGTILRHCIHTCDYYLDRISRRESYILFLRSVKSPTAPWYTLEVEPAGNIRAKRTTGDNQNKDLDKALPFLRKWQKEIQKRIGEKEKLLAVESDRLRKENYRNLRKNQNRIWHGKLQGQLLADVLEQDFMGVIG